MTKGLHKNSLQKVNNPHQWMIDDARMELIQQIKAEIERLKHFESSDDAWATLCELEGFLDTIKEQPGFPNWYPNPLEEQPVCEGLEEEIEYYLDHAELKAKCNGISVAQDYFDDLTNAARHFAKWGAEHAKECEECPSRGNTHSYLKGLEDGKKEMKEMMKEAVECVVCAGMEGDKWIMTYIGSYESMLKTCKAGDRVRIIIVKEEEK